MQQGGTPWAQVVWYDAVTVEGELKWQDTLNDLNRCTQPRAQGP